MNTDDMTFEQLCELFNYEPKKRPLNTEEAAAIAHLKPITFDMKRIDGSGPRFFRPRGSRKVLYSEKDVLAWIANGARTSTSGEHKGINRRAQRTAQCPACGLLNTTARIQSSITTSSAPCRKPIWSTCAL